MTLPILVDDDVAALISMPEAIGAIEATLKLKARGEFLTPPRHYVSNKHGALVFTVGGHDERGVIGFRVYDTFATDVPHEQVVAVFDSETGQLKGLVLGSLLGAVRTGAIGGVAVKYASRGDSRGAAIIGTGLQARTQLAAAAAVRDLREVRVYSRNEDRREGFAKEMAERLHIDIVPVSSAAEAVRGADIVIAATNSGTPSSMRRS